MKEFFRGWRRKAGIGSLAMALVLTLAWVRSLTVADFIDVPHKTRLHMLNSHNGSLDYCRIERNSLDGDPDMTPVGIATLMTITAADPLTPEVVGVNFKPVRTVRYVPTSDRPPIKWNTGSDVADKIQMPENLITVTQRGFCGIEYVVKNCNFTHGGEQFVFLTVPYWSIVLPLTAISAFLLLKKPSKSTPKKTAQSVANEEGGAAS